MPLASAGLQHREETILKALFSLLIVGVERIHQAITEGIGIDVKRRVDEVGDVAPEVAVVVIEGKDGTEALNLNGHPDIADLIGRQFTLRPRIVEPTLEFAERDLAHDSIEHVLDLGRQNHAATLGIVFYAASMWVAGITQGLMWREYGPDGYLVNSFADTVAALHPMFIMRMTGGLLYLSGALVMSYNVWMTLAGKLRDEAPMTSPSYDPAKDKPIVGSRPAAHPDSVPAE